METIELTEEQQNTLIDALADVYYEDGYFDVEIEIDETLTIEARGSIDTDGYVEDDAHCGYMNGTGGYVETYRRAWIELTAVVCNESDGSRTRLDVDEDTVQAAEDYLNSIA